MQQLSLWLIEIVNRMIVGMADEVADEVVEKASK